MYPSATVDAVIVLLIFCTFTTMFYMVCLLRSWEQKMRDFGRIIDALVLAENERESRVNEKFRVLTEQLDSIIAQSITIEQLKLLEELSRKLEQIMNKSIE